MTQEKDFCGLNYMTIQRERVSWSIFVKATEQYEVMRRNAIRKFKSDYVKLALKICIEREISARGTTLIIHLFKSLSSLIFWVYTDQKDNIKVSQLKCLILMQLMFL